MPSMALRPHDSSRPSASTAKEQSYPAPAATTLFRLGTTMRVKRGIGWTWPSPNSPPTLGAIAADQLDSVPSALTSSVWAKPAASFRGALVFGRETHATAG